MSLGIDAFAEVFNDPLIDPALDYAYANGVTVICAAGNNSGVDLSWTDNSSDEDEFVIERCQETGKKKNQVCTFAPLTTVPANTTSFADSPGSGTFKYRVRARNAGGASDYSNEATSKQ